MKRLFSLLFFALSYFAVQAQTYDYLIFQSTDGEQSVKAMGAVITFSGDNMVVTGTDATLTLPLSNLQKFFFAATPSGVEAVDSEQESEMVVYTVSGQFVGCFTDSRAVTNELPKGIYVVRSSGETHKMMVK